ncbi:MAG: hypothetical protein NVSMB3_06710 [Acidobacteriaceae bacterium]
MQSSPVSARAGQIEGPVPPGETLRSTARPPSKPLPIPADAPHDSSATFSALQSLCYIIVVAIFTVTFTLQPFRIPSASMEPTLLVGDFLLVTKREPAPKDWLSPYPGSAIHRGDIVVFHYPVDPSLHLVKRVIGLPGDRLRMRNGLVLINGAALEEPYAVYTGAREDAFRDDFPHLGSTDPDVDSHWWMQMHRLVDHGELRIPAGQYFVLGDNRNDSEDSRYWGLVPRASIVGKPLLVYFSLRDPRAEAELPRDGGGPGLPDRQRRRSLGEAIVDLARWDRVLHVVR